MNIITLDQHDIAEIKSISENRMRNDMRYGANYTLYYDVMNLPGRFEHECDSFGAEWAYCKMVGVMPDTNWKHYMPYDAIVNGHRVDVKWTKNINGCLQAKVGKDWIVKPEYFALLVGRLPVYLFCGYMRADDLLRPGRIDASTRQRTAVYSARQDELYQEMY